MSQDVLLLRFDAPLMSFGGVMVDERGVTEAFPTQAMMTGLLGNALGYEHGDFAKLQRLQERLVYAVRRDQAGRKLVDYQTVDLGQDFLREGWTTRGAPAGRSGGSARTGTHIRHRHYWADARYTVALTLRPAGEDPTVERCSQALREPERPLFLGRKTCLPAAPLLAGRVQAPSLFQALVEAPAPESRRSREDRLDFWWPRDEGPAEPSGARLLAVTDQRDWSNQVHVGRRFLWHSSREPRHA